MIAQLPRLRIGYDDSGEGQPLVLLHGFPHDRTLWTTQRASLMARARCLVPDLRGFGDSSTHGPFSIDGYADDVIALLDYLGIERAAVCGLSMGGYVAMAMWRRHSHRISAMVFCDTRAGADSEGGRRRRNELIDVAGHDGVEALAETQLTGMVGSTTRARRPEVMSVLRTMMVRQPVAGIVGALEAMRDRADSHGTIATIAVPSLVIVGEEDSLTPISEARIIAESLPPVARVRMEIIEGAGHVPCIERPSAMTHALADFLATLDT